MHESHTSFLDFLLLPTPNLSGRLEVARRRKRPMCKQLAYPSQVKDGLHQQGGCPSLDVVQEEGLSRQPLLPRRQDTKEASSHRWLQQHTNNRQENSVNVMLTLHSTFAYFIAVLPNLRGHRRCIWVRRGSSWLISYRFFAFASI